MPPSSSYRFQDPAAATSSGMEYSSTTASQPLHHTSTLNHKLQVEHLDVAPDDPSCHAAVVRGTATFVSSLFTPRQVLGFLRLLKALTFCGLVLTGVADVLYVTFLHIQSSPDVRALAGGTRDVVLRGYGLVLAVLAIGIEVDAKRVVKQWPALKGFVARSGLLLLVAVSTGSQPYNYQRVSVNDDAAYYYGYQEGPQIPSAALVFQMVTSWAL